MHDLKLLRDNPDLLRDGLKRRGSKTSIDGLLEAEKARRELLTAMEQQRHELKQKSEEFGRRKDKSGGPPAELKTLSTAIKEQEQKAKDVEEQIQRELALIPNNPHSSVPVGDPTANKLIKTVGEKP